MMSVEELIVVSNVTLYVTSICPYCVKAKQLLNKKGIPFTTINISENHQLRQDMIEKSGGRFTVPQIFVNDHYIGGCDDLYALDRTGELDHLLKENKVVR